MHILYLPASHRYINLHSLSQVEPSYANNSNTGQREYALMLRFVDGTNLLVVEPTSIDLLEQHLMTAFLKTDYEVRDQAQKVEELLGRLDCWRRARGVGRCNPVSNERKDSESPDQH